MSSVTTDATPAAADDAEAPEEEKAPAPLLTLRDGLTAVVDTPAGFAQVCADFGAGTGPVAIDAERASGYRYSARAYLIQLRREGSGTALVDPIAFESMAPLQDALGDTEWILHAATQDLPCLAEVGLTPTSLFDTELAGRLLGYPRVGLATLVETILGKSMRKEHSAVDWSTRPLPMPWLEYAALDVEVLVELKEIIEQELVDTGKDDWARQEFEHLLDHQAPVRVEPWRRTSGLHRVRGRRALAGVRELWETRDSIARERDVTPGRILPDSAIIEAAVAAPLTREALLKTKGFHGRGAERYSRQWAAALATARDLPEESLPSRSPRLDGPPVPRAWAEKDPVAARRLVIARKGMAALAAEHNLPVENIVTPDYLRRVLWTPPSARTEEQLTDEVAAALAELGARPWQIGLVTSVIVEAIISGDIEPPEPELTELPELPD
ncbi:Ribonuclease D (modular protein) [metagenome]|uniref:Ribonuclease D (Modular protein) n=1 Tax=metagenome TaxID=256318 RepID=A0A2P2BZ92_9ZZZZ